MATVNNVTRMLDSRKIPYTAFELPVEKIGAARAAQLLGAPPAMVFKTIVALRETPGKAILAVIPGNCELNLKALATALGEKKVRLATLREAEQITGLQAGGISPLALINKGFQVIIDQTAKNFAQIHISGGQRGLNLRLGVEDLAAITRARFGLIGVESDTAEDID